MMNPTMNMTISLSFVVYVLENKLTGQFSLKKMTAAIGFPVYAEDLPHRPEWRGFILSVPSSAVQTVNPSGLEYNHGEGQPEPLKRGFSMAFGLKTFRCTPYKPPLKATCRMIVRAERDERPHEREKH